MKRRIFLLVIAALVMVLGVFLLHGREPRPCQSNPMFYLKGSSVDCR